MREIDKNKLKVGDIVGVVSAVKIGWKQFRYGRIYEKTIKRITPARTKFVMDDGSEYRNIDTFYEIDEETRYKDSVARCAESLDNIIFEINEVRRKGLVTNYSDESIIGLSEALLKAREIIKAEEGAKDGE